jgi:hypothetical protein
MRRPRNNGEPPATRGDNDTQHSDHHRPPDPASTLRREIQGKTAAKETVERADNV